MRTPYGEIPDRFVTDMSAQEMHDYLQKRYSRRRVLSGGAAMGALAVTGPVFWRRSQADTSTITSISNPAVMDSVTLVRASVTGPARLPRGAARAGGDSPTTGTEVHLDESVR